MAISQYELALPRSQAPEKKMPMIGLGTWLAPAGEVEEATYIALREGYRHIDCAAIYGNEKEVGSGIKRWLDEGNSRDDIWVTTKLWNNSHRPDRVEAALDKSLVDLQLDFVDLYLIHWPCPMKAGDAMIPRDDRPGRDGQNMPLVENVSLNETWKAMEDLLETKKTNAIGVCNFTRAEVVEGILSSAKHRPDVIQLELHPHLPQTEYREWLSDQGIAIQAYSPYGNLNPVYESKTGSEGRVIDQPVIKQIASETGLSSAQVILSWGITKGHAVLPKSTNSKRLKENLGACRLSEDHMDKIDALGVNQRYNDMKGKFGYVTFQEEKSPEQVQSEIWSSEYSQASARKMNHTSHSSQTTPVNRVH